MMSKKMPLLLQNMWQNHINIIIIIILLRQYQITAIAFSSAGFLLIEHNRLQGFSLFCKMARCWQV